MRRILLGVLFIGLLAGGYYRDCPLEATTKNRAALPAAIQPVTAGVAVEMPMPIEVPAIASVPSIPTVTVKSRIDRQIDQVHFKQGQEVKEGDDRTSCAQLVQSEATPERDRGSRAKLENARQSELATGGILLAQKFADVETSLTVFETTRRADQAAVQSAWISSNYATILAPTNGRSVIAQGLVSGHRVVVGGQLRLDNVARVAAQWSEAALSPVRLAERQT